MTTYDSGSKPRYDNKGTEFGNIHRHLPKSYCMTDIDRIKAREYIINGEIINIDLKTENKLFVEYRTIWGDDMIEFTAVFDLKHDETDGVKEQCKVKQGSSIATQIELAKRLGARFFIVIATDGSQPFTFHERKEGSWENVGVLSYTKDNSESSVKEFWKKIGLER